ncbi:MAG: hypothetical protein ACJAZO_002470 [Myxococcota bacterium]
MDECDDGRQNGSETYIDCGGSCPECGPGATCLQADDCGSGVCDGTCQLPSCGDGIQNGGESNIDCGGVCGSCPNGASCDTGSSCDSGVCGTDGLCALGSCSDNISNRDETDVDCGGQVCSPCDDYGACATNDDCVNGKCTDGRCREPSCEDEVANGTELGVDCGGECELCGVGTPCSTGEACTTGVCGVDDTCAEASCSDGVQNGVELGLDCGGDCDGCPDGGACNVDDDCVSGACGDQATCEEADLEPEPFTLNEVTDAQPGSQASTNTVVLEGFNGTRALSISGPDGLSVFVNGEEMIANPIDVESGDLLSLQAVAGGFGSNLTWTTSLGTYSTTWRVQSASQFNAFSALGTSSSQPQPNSTPGNSRFPMGSIPGIAGKLIEITRVGICGDSDASSGDNRYRAFGGGIDFTWVAGQQSTAATHRLAPTPDINSTYNGFTGANVSHRTTVPGASVSIEWDYHSDYDGGGACSFTDEFGTTFNDSGLGIRTWVKYAYVDP